MIEAVGAAIAALSLGAWWWGRGVNARPDPGISVPARTAWKLGPAGAIVGICVALAAAMARCS